LSRKILNYYCYDFHYQLENENVNDFDYQLINENDIDSHSNFLKK